MTGFEDDSPRGSNMASMDSAPTKVRRVLEDQQSLLRSGPVIEVFEVKCRNGRASSGLRSGLRHRSLKITMECSVVGDDDQEQRLLGDQIATSSQSGLKAQRGFATCMEKYFSACRSNVNTLIGRKRRRGETSEKPSRPSQNTQQMNSDSADRSKIPCLGRGWRGFRKKLGEVIKIEEEIVTSVPRSILYYA